MGSKGGGGGFFSLFDWNRKSRKKKLFASKSDDTDLTNAKESSELNCTSSVTDDDGVVTRAPGVVARLMGLDSLPTTSGVETTTFSTPFLESSRPSKNRSLGSLRSLGFEVNNPLTLGLIKTEPSTYSAKQPELSRQSMPSSPPIEKFQMEILPQRFGKSVPVGCYHKHMLMSPVRSTRALSYEQAAHIMEASSKILAQKSQPMFSRNRDSLAGSGPSWRPRVSKDNGQGQSSQRVSSSPLVSSRKFAESNNLKERAVLHGRKLPKKDHAPEKGICNNRLPSRSVEVRDKGKTTSLATHAKVSVHQKECMNMPSRNSQFSNKQDDFRLKRLNNQKNKQQKRVVTTSSSGFPKQNKQKQNSFTSKDKVPVKTSVSNHQAKKDASTSAATGRNKSLKKNHADLQIAYGTESLATSHYEKEQAINESCRSGIGESATNILVGRLEKHLQPSIVNDKHTKWDKMGKQDATDVVSFTFNSPLGKTSTGSHPSVNIKDKYESGGKSNTDIHGVGTEHATNIPESRLEFDADSGKDLGTLLEQKLRELILKLESDSSNQPDVFGKISASTLEYLLPSPENITAEETEHYKPPLQTHNEDVSNSELSSINDIGCSFRRSLQESKDWINCPSSSDAYMHIDLKQQQQQQQQPIPFPILETSFSVDSCSIDHSTDESELFSCTEEVEENVRTDTIISSVESDAENSDSASLSLSEIVDGELVSNLEIEYVRDVLYSADINTDSSYCDTRWTLDPVIFHQLENQKRRYRNTDEDGRMKRKVLFDCVGECLDLKRSCYFNSSYQSWNTGVKLMGKIPQFTEEIYKEIEGWRCMEKQSVDELLNIDMTLGRWVQFETDVYSTGADIQGEIFSFLLDEVLNEFIA